MAELSTPIVTVTGPLLLLAEARSALGVNLIVSGDDVLTKILEALKFPKPEAVKITKSDVFDKSVKSFADFTQLPIINIKSIAVKKELNFKNLYFIIFFLQLLISKSYYGIHQTLIVGVMPAGTLSPFTSNSL